MGYPREIKIIYLKIRTFAILTRDEQSIFERAYGERAMIV